MTSFTTAANSSKTILLNQLTNHYFRIKFMFPKEYNKNWLKNSSLQSETTIYKKSLNRHIRMGKHFICVTEINELK